MTAWFNSVAFVLLVGVIFLVIFPPVGAFILGFITPVVAILFVPFVAVYSAYVWIRYPEQRGK